MIAWYKDFRLGRVKPQDKPGISSTNHNKYNTYYIFYHSVSLHTLIAITEAEFGKYTTTSIKLSPV